MNTKKKLFLFGMVLVAGAVAVPVFAQDAFGLKATADASTLSAWGTNIPVMIGNILGSILGLVAVIFFALMLYGGVLWMTARGDDSQTKKATGTITAAIVGIMIILASYAITSFVFNSIGTPGAVTGGGLGMGTATDTSGTGMQKSDNMLSCNSGKGNCKAGCEATEDVASDGACAIAGQGFVCCTPKEGVPNQGGCGMGKVCKHTTQCTDDTAVNEGSACGQGEVCCPNDKVGGPGAGCESGGGKCKATGETWEKEQQADCGEGTKCFKTREECASGNSAAPGCCTSGKDCCTDVMGPGYSCIVKKTGATCTDAISFLCMKASDTVCAKSCTGGTVAVTNCVPKSGVTVATLCGAVTSGIPSKGVANTEELIKKKDAYCVQYDVCQYDSASDSCIPYGGSLEPYCSKRKATCAQNSSYCTPVSS